MLSAKETNVGSLLLALIVILGIAAAVHLIGRPRLYDTPDVSIPTPAVTPPGTTADTGAPAPNVIYECVRDGVRTFSDQDCGPDSTVRVIDDDAAVGTVATSP